MAKARERVIFRREYNRDRKKWGYIAVYPDHEAGPGNVMGLSFALDDGNVVHAMYTYYPIKYLYNRKIIHKGTEEAKQCLAAIERFYEADGKFRVVEKMTRR